MTEQPIKVTLVHGTFARNAKWVRKGSSMTSRLEETGVEWERFRWSGCNSHRARIRAAEQLAKRLLEQKEDGVRQAVVAHSHGGNIAVHAVWRLMDVRDGSIPVVTLATPFLFASRKHFRKVVLIGAALVALMAVGGAFVFTLAEGVPDRDADKFWFVVLLYIMSILVVVQLLACIYWLIGHGQPWRKDNRDEFITAVQTPDAEGEGLLVVRAADDEASTTLALAQLSTWLAMTAMRLSQPQAWIPTFSAVGFVGLMLGVLSVVDTADLVILILAIATTLICVFSLGVVSIPALFGVIHGPDGITANLFAVVSAESTPPGKHDVVQRPMRHFSAEGLAHSSLYDDKQVIGWVIDHVSR